MYQRRVFTICSTHYIQHMHECRPIPQIIASECWMVNAAYAAMGVPLGLIVLILLVFMLAL